MKGYIEEHDPPATEKTQQTKYIQINHLPFPKHGNINSRQDPLNTTIRQLTERNTEKAPQQDATALYYLETRYASFEKYYLPCQIAFWRRTSI